MSLVGAVKLLVLFTLGHMKGLLLFFSVIGTTIFGSGVCFGGRERLVGGPSGEFYLDTAEVEELKNRALDGLGQPANRLAYYYGFYKLDFAEEVKWLTISAENGNRRGCAELAGFARNPTVEQSLQRRAAFWQKQIDEGKCSGTK